MVSYDGQRINGPGALVTPLRSPTLGKESALYVVNHPKLPRGAAPGFTVVHVPCIP